MIYTKSNDLNNAAWFSTTLTSLYYVEWFILGRMIPTMLNDRKKDEWFELHLMIWTILNDLY